MVSSMPCPGEYDRGLIRDFEDMKEVVTQVRSIRKDKNISPKEAVRLLVKSSANGNYNKMLEPVIVKLANLSTVEMIREDPGDTIPFIVKNMEYFIPVGNLVDLEEEIAKLETELEYTEGFLGSVRKKLGNEKFVGNAPEQVVEKERQKMADAEEKIRVLEAQLARLRSQPS
jgi:valyl-tRNA synthetase